MVTRSRETTVTFRRPFALAEVDGPQPAGTYRIVTDDEEIEGISFIAYRRTATMLQVPSIDSRGGLTQYIAIDPVGLAAALAADDREAAEDNAQRHRRDR
jgi:hypothetical protein